MTQKELQQNIPSLGAQIEALLFVRGDAMKTARLAKLLQVSDEKFLQAIDDLERYYQENNRGLALVRYDDTIQLVTSAHCAEVVDQMVAGDLQEDLSTSALEVLAIVAYRGPISRMDIDAIRGVNCAFALRNLMIRGLIRRATHPDNNRSYVYSVTGDFLSHLGLSRIEELPDFVKLREHKKVEAVLPIDSE